MKRLSEYFIQEVSYRYESETEKEKHQKHMISAGFKVVKNQPMFEHPLLVTYQYRQINDRIPRL